MNSLRPPISTAPSALRRSRIRLVLAAALLALLVALLTGCLGEEGVPDTGGGGVTWADVSAAFGGEGCQGCHGGANKPNLTNCTTLVNGFHIAPLDPSVSVVYLVANGDLESPLGIGGTDMQFDSAANVTALAAWITDGASCN